MSVVGVSSGTSTNRTVTDANGVPVIRTLKSLCLNSYSQTEGWSSYEKGHLLDLHKNCSLKGMLDGDPNITDSEKRRLFDRLNQELADIKERQRVDQLYARRRNLEKLVKTDSRWTGYMVLPCGHEKRKAERFSIGRPDEIRCYHHSCGKTFVQTGGKLVEKIGK